MSEGSETPVMAVQMGAVDVHVEGGENDTLTDVQEAFDHAVAEALDGADELADKHL